MTTVDLFDVLIAVGALLLVVGLYLAFGVAAGLLALGATLLTVGLFGAMAKAGQRGRV